jgi:hypothetical protein
MSVTKHAVRADAARYLTSLEAKLTSTTTVVAQERAILRIRIDPNRTAEKLELLARAYALSMFFAADADIVKRFAKQHGKRLPVRDRARLFLEVLCAPAPRHAHKTYSRWAKAIEHLQSSRVLPSKVKALGQNGEGIDKWTRGNNAAKTLSAKKDLQEAVMVSINGPDGPTHWKLWSSVQVAAVKQALQGIEPEATPKLRTDSKPQPNPKRKPKPSASQRPKRQGLSAS